MRLLAILFLLGVPALAADKLSPFTEVLFEDGKVLVTYVGARYELLSIDGHATEKLVAFCKREFGRKWQKRFAEDLCEVFDAMGHHYGRTVRLELSADGKRLTVERAPMTEDNRHAVWRARERAERAPANLTEEQVRADVRFLLALLKERYAYFGRSKKVQRTVVAALERIGGAQTTDAFARKLTEILANFGDGHLRVRPNPLPGIYPPLLFGVDGDQVFAFTPDRSQVLGVVKALDGVPIGKWRDAAARFVARGSEQYRSWRGARFLRQVGFLREQLELPATPALQVTFADGSTRAFPLSRRRPIYGPWPRTPTRRLDGDIGYLRVDDMAGDVGPYLRALEGLRDTKGLVVDARHNGGGTRHLVRALLPHFVAKPRVVNVAKPRDPATDLADRFVYPADWDGWTKAERAAIAEFAKTFRSEWKPAWGAPWHYLVVSPGAWRYDKPVVVLLDPICFSAADILLGALKGLPNVKLLGLPSGGGSARARPCRLPRSGIEVRLASMASFQPSGKLYDGNGVQPDVVVAPKPADWIGEGDSVLDAALAHLREKMR